MKAWDLCAKGLPDLLLVKRERGVDKGMDKSIDMSIDKSVIKSINQPINNQPINPPINQSINQPINQSINQPINNQPINHQPINQSINQSINPPINQSINQSINPPINPPMETMEAETMPSVLLAEVKGPRDRLSDAQSWWLGEFEACGVNVEVLRLSDERATGETQLVGAEWLRRVAAEGERWDEVRERDVVKGEEKLIMKEEKPPQEVKLREEEKPIMKEEKPPQEEKTPVEEMKPREETTPIIEEEKSPNEAKPPNEIPPPTNQTSQPTQFSSLNSSLKSLIQPATLPAQPLFRPQDEIIDICSSSSSSSDVVAIATPSVEPVRIKREEPVLAFSQEMPRRRRKRQASTPSRNIQGFFSKRFH